MPAAGPTVSLSHRPQVPAPLRDTIKASQPSGPTTAGLGPGNCDSLYEAGGEGPGWGDQGPSEM